MRNWFPVIVAAVWLAMTAFALSDMALFAGSTAPRHRVQRPAAAATTARRPSLRTEFGAL